MLKKIHIQKFRLCGDVVIDNVGKILALVGRNGAGKSNILQAIFQTSRIATSTNVAPPEILQTGPKETSLEFEIDGARYRYWQKFMGGNRRPGPVVLLSEGLEFRKSTEDWSEIFARYGAQITLRDRSLPVGEVSSALTALTALLPATDMTVEQIRPAFKFLSGIRYYPIDEPVAQGEAERPIPRQDYEAWKSAYEATGNADNSVLMRILHWHLTKSDDLQVLKDLLGKNSIGLIDDIAITPVGGTASSSSGGQSTPQYYLVRFSPARGTAGPFHVAYGMLSLGTRRILRLFTHMLFDKSSVMLIEQPEDGLHQGMTKNVLELLRDNADAQLIMSSHSSVLLSNLDPDDIRLVHLHDGFTTVRSLTDLERTSAVQFMNEQGRLYDFIHPLLEEG
jgi:predicted ATPase